MSDACETKCVLVEVQENGIVRDLSGRILARLVEDVSFDSITTKIKDETKT